MQPRLVDIFLENARRFPSKTAIICGNHSLSYSHLAEKVKEYASCIGGKPCSFRVKQYDKNLGEDFRICQQSENSPSLLPRHIPIPFRAKPSIYFLAEYLGIHLSGNVAAPLDKDLPNALFDENLARFYHMQLPEGSADVLCTTGTTGTAKAIIISHEAIVANAENLIAAHGYTSELTFVINGPLNHIGSLSKIYPVLYLGGTIHIVDGLRDMNTFFSALENSLGPVATFLVPSSVRMLLAFAKDRLASLDGKIDFIETGAAAMPQSDMEALCSALPSARLYNTYASTETGIVSTFNFAAGECVAACLGVPMKHSGIFITGEGKVACTGSTLMTGYLGDEEMTHIVLRDGVLYTNDLGRVDDEGRLWLQGRSDDVINVGGFKVAPTEVEDAALSMIGIADCLCVPASHPILGTVLKLIVVPAAPTILTTEGKLDKKSIARYLQTRLEPHKIPTYYEVADTICRSFNGKPDRKSYL